MKTDETNPADWLLLAKDRLQAADAVRQACGPGASAVERRNCESTGTTSARLRLRSAVALGTLTQRRRDAETRGGLV